MNAKNKSYIKLLIWILLLMLIGSVIGCLAKSSVDTWYQTLSRSPLTPPDFVFGVVWTILYAVIATSGWLVWGEKPCASKLVKILYMLQLILNWMWTPLFFRYHLIGPALTCLATIIVLVTILIVKAYENLSKVSLLLTPYLLWLVFAGYLNFYIWLYN